MNLLKTFPSKLLESHQNVHYAFGTRAESLTHTSFPLLKTLPLIRAEQVHGHLVTEIKQPPASSPQIMPLADGLLTSVKGVVLAIKTADCLPLILFDPKNEILSIVHAGWRGALEKIATQAVKQMVEKGSNTRDLLAIMGPAISQKVYEVDQTLYDRFEAPQFFLSRTEPGKYLFDLKNKVRQELLNLGLLAEHCEDIAACTYLDKEHFYSFRREPGITERQWTLAYLD